MSATGLEPAIAENNASTEAAQVDSEAAEIEGADPAPAADVDSGKPPRDRVQERIDALTERRYAEALRADRAEYRLQEAERRLQEREAKPQTVAPSDDKPTLESVGFDSEAYQQALAGWYDKRLDAKAEEALSRREKDAQHAKTLTEFKRREAEFIKSKPDYTEKVVQGSKLGKWACTQEMDAAMSESDMGPEIAYYLSDNPAKSVEISRLSPSGQIREIGRIEERLAVAKAAPAPVSKAPPPVAKVEAAESAAIKDPTEMTQAQFNKWRKSFM